ncbi:helix-turn-helix domain-containing protein [Paenibacillus pabuli]|uniref:helix-turn-helix domain-containing protein n=1 Tax=Paenibacillus pabuli TaxID=1472 RepID=UPI003CF15C8B
MHERYQTILLDLHSVSTKDISKIIGSSLSTVYNYINAYRKEGIPVCDSNHLLDVGPF